jgi:hypothetical protein
MVGSSSNSLLFDAYMVRGEALSGLGSTEQVRERDRVGEERRVMSGIEKVKESM